MYDIYGYISEGILQEILRPWVNEFGVEIPVIEMFTPQYLENCAIITNEVPMPEPGWTAKQVDGQWVFAPYVAPAIPIPELAQTKRGMLRDSCSEAITRSSFQSSALGAVHNYDCRMVDQLNLKVRYDIASYTDGEEPLWASDGTRYEWKNHTAEEIMEVMIDMNDHIKSSQVNLASKLAAVDAATTKAQIDAIVW